MMLGEELTNMSIQETKLTEIADAIRTKKGTTDTIIANDFANEILNLPSGGSGGFIDDFYKEQSQGFYNMRAADIRESQRIWAEVGITENDTNYRRIRDSKYRATIKYVPKLSNISGNARAFLTNCNSIVTVPELLFDATVTELGGMFKWCTSLSYIPPMDTSNITHMDEMFMECTSLTSIPPMDTSKVTIMNSLFDGCTRLTSIPPMDTSKVTNATNLCRNCAEITSIPPMDFTSCTSLYAAFQNCTKLVNIDITNTSKVRDWGFFLPPSYNSKMETLKTLDLTSWNGQYFFTDSSSYQPPTICKTLLFVPNTIKRSIFFNYCTGLSLESLASIVDGLDTVTTTQTVTFANSHKPSSTNNIRLQDKQVTAMQNKGWTVAFK